MGEKKREKQEEAHLIKSSHFLHGPLIPQRPSFSRQRSPNPRSFGGTTGRVNTPRGSRRASHPPPSPARPIVPHHTDTLHPKSAVFHLSSVCSSSHPPAPPATYYGRELVPPPSPLPCARASPPTVLPSAILNSLTNSPPPPSPIFSRSRPRPHGRRDVSRQDTQVHRRPGIGPGGRWPGPAGTPRHRRHAGCGEMRRQPEGRCQMRRSSTHGC